MLLLKVSVADPVAVDWLGGTSLAPVNVALNITLGFGAVLLLQESSKALVKTIRVKKNNLRCIKFCVLG